MVVNWNKLLKRSVSSIILYLYRQSEYLKNQATTFASYYFQNCLNLHAPEVNYVRRSFYYIGYYYPRSRDVYPLFDKLHRPDLQVNWLQWRSVYANILALFTDTEMNNCFSIYTITKQKWQKSNKYFFIQFVFQLP